MAVTGLTPVQQRAIDALVANGRLARVPVDLTKAAIFIRQAQDVITDLPHLTKAQNRYNLAYDACHDVGEAVLAAHGYRTLSGPGQHEAIGLFLCAVIDKPPGDQDARRFDQLPRSRNRQRYDARPVSNAEATLAVQTAVALLGAALARGLPNPSICSVPRHGHGSSSPCASTSRVSSFGGVPSSAKPSTRTVP